MPFRSFAVLLWGEALWQCCERVCFSVGTFVVLMYFGPPSRFDTHRKVMVSAFRSPLQTGSVRWNQIAHRESDWAAHAGCEGRSQVSSITVTLHGMPIGFMHESGDIWPYWNSLQENSDVLDSLHAEAPRPASSQAYPLKPQSWLSWPGVPT